MGLTELLVLLAGHSGVHTRKVFLHVLRGCCSILFVANAFDSLDVVEDVQVGNRAVRLSLNLVRGVLGVGR